MPETTPAPSAPKFNEPALVLTYGRKGVGKTTDCLYAFPDAVFVAAPGALKTAVSIVGLPYAPARASGIKTFMDVTDFIRNKMKGSRWNVIVIDDFSLQCEESFNVIEKEGKPGLQFWGRVRDHLLDFRSTAQDSGVHVIINCHIREPHTDEKKGYIRGGPMLPGAMPEDFPKSCHMVLRAVKTDSYPIWPVVYSANELDDSYVEGDRHGFIPSVTKMAPMNLSEILRQGYGAEGKFGIRRPQGLEWMEKVAEQISGKLSGTVPGDENSKAILRAFKPLVEQKYTQNPLHVQWVFRDSLARAALRDAHARDRFAWLGG